MVDFVFLFISSQYTPINKHLAPNLRHLKLNWIKTIIDMKSIEMLFECDVLLSLAQFTLSARIRNVDVLLSVLSKLSSQCLYRFDVIADMYQVMCLYPIQAIFYQLHSNSSKDQFQWN